MIVQILAKDVLRELEQGATRLTFEFAPDQFAPAIYVGTEGLKLNLLGSDWVITGVNLFDRKVHLAKVTK